MSSIKSKNSYYRNFLITVFSAMLLVSFSTSTAAKEPLNIQSVTFTKDKEAVNYKVRAECKLLEKTEKYLVYFGKKNFSSVTTEKKAVAGAYNISAKIIGTIGGPGGAMSGRKGATIKGTVKKNGKLVGSFEAFRSSGGGFGFGYRGTCSLLGRSVKRLGRDITEWAVKPTLNAKIGELK